MQGQGSKGFYKEESERCKGNRRVIGREGEECWEDNRSFNGKGKEGVSGNEQVDEEREEAKGRDKVKGCRHG